MRIEASGSRIAVEAERRRAGRAARTGPAHPADLEKRKFKIGGVLATGMLIGMALGVLTSWAMRPLAILSIVFGGMLLGPDQAQAGWVVETLTFAPAREVKSATGRVVIAGPGVFKEENMPSAGGRIEEREPGKAVASASVDLARQTTSSAFVARADLGFTGLANADIETRVELLGPVERMRIRVFRQSAQVEDVYFGPDVSGQLEYGMSLRELTTGVILFDSATTITESSPDEFTDDTGMLNWARSPGFFGGVLEPGNVGGIPNVFSNNKWLLETTLLEFDFLVPDGLRTLEFAFEISASGFADSGTSAYGFSSAIPEPATLALFGLGAAGLIGRGWRRKRARAWSGHAASA